MFLLLCSRTKITKVYYCKSGSKSNRERKAHSNTTPRTDTMKRLHYHIVHIIYEQLPERILPNIMSQLYVCMIRNICLDDRE